MTRGQGRAVQYVRMSTDMQRYSIENQTAAIALYAAQRGLTILRSYEDAGRSGLRLDGRAGLRSLIDEVKTGGADFDIILVYDVSRWGRFQDTDESAYYEYICKEAGIRVEYCAEQFENDGSLIAAVLKNIKRVMAGEYSRELSTKVFAGQSRIAAKGFHVGATPGYGLRRFLVDEQGNRKLELANGQRKSIDSDRVILVPGPSHEVETVQYVYKLFVDDQASLNEIARTLNAQGIPNVIGCSWSSISVRELLANEKYLGTCVYNRTSKKLGAKWRRNPRTEWIRKLGAFEAVVSPERFEAAQAQLRENASFYTDNELLDYLTATWCRAGTLGRDVIDGARNAPAGNTYRKHFGSLGDAYRRVGYRRPMIANRTNNLKLRKEVCQDIVSRVTASGGAVVQLRGCQLRINDELNATVIAGRTSPSSGSSNRWRFSYRSKRKPDILVVARMEPIANCVKDYFLLPFLVLPHGTWITVSGINYERLERFRSVTLDPFIELCARKSLKELLS